MPAAHATFGLAPAVRTGGVLANGVHQLHRDFMDFVVDGHPLLHQLSDLDAVSPLASDVPPAIFVTHVRRLLLEAAPPLPDNRYVIYGCPECEGLECGAVTAVIEQQDTDIVWRDFAWQTTETLDFDRDGYHGIGPFRFDAAQYRAELSRLLPPEDAPEGTAPLLRRRVLLIGSRVAVLAKLAAALRTINIGAEIAADADRVPPTEIRTYTTVLFGASIAEHEKEAVRAAFDRAGAEPVYLDGLTPIIPVLVAQIENALDQSPPEQRRLVRLVAADDEAGVEVTSACRVQLYAYRQDRLHRTHAELVFEDLLEPGKHRIPLNERATRGQSYIVARTLGSVLVTPMAR
ncbi:oxidoreductase [Streptomyces spiroverticillatus]|uniref:Oxidoreductase n=1 Tax=Streptomyces finlayi TaxID=67296 RepID=A0A918WYX3_9ACTN|nr:oxidoreductase [Streptomyces finlayi]GHA14821.1 oxidoreductase [Streptomyces spiroverticillatus]GHC97090.1 oxidoreductase [Streptomyces finlayi]